MGIHIGLMIWKEMKAQSVSVGIMARELGIGKTRAQEILGRDNIDVLLLARISEILKYNFFEYYETGAIFAKIKEDRVQQSTAEILRLKELLAEKNRLLELKDKVVKSQANMLTLFEREGG